MLATLDVYGHSTQYVRVYSVVHCSPHLRLALNSRIEGLNVVDDVASTSFFALP
jgi:hypothetical protein